MGDLAQITRWSLADSPESERLALMREVYGPAINMDFVPLAPDPVFEIQSLSVPGVTVQFGRSSPHIVRTRDMSNAHDDILLVWSTPGSRGRMTHCGREVENGAAVILSGMDPFTAEMHSEFRPVNIRIRRALLAPLLPSPEDALMRPIAREQPAFRLLAAYLDTLRREGPPTDPALAGAVACHIVDLVALSLGVAHDGAAPAATRGVRAARLAAIKHWALERLGDPSLSVTQAAKSQNVSPRYVQMLFEAEGETFSEFLLHARLALVRRRLSSPLAAAMPISGIVFDAGFGDLSYFNRTFRAAYGEAPTDLRRRSLTS